MAVAIVDVVDIDGVCFSHLIHGCITATGSA